MFAETLKLVLAGANRHPARSVSRRLDRLFAALRGAADAKEASHIEASIWSEWMSHEDAAAEHQLERAARAIAAGKNADAKALLDTLVAAHPELLEQSKSH